MRGVVEKCNFCHGRWHAAKQLAAAAGKPDTEPVSYLPACAEACPTGAIQFGDLNDAASVPSKAAAQSNSFRLLEKLGTEPKIYYRSEKDWVRGIAAAPKPGTGAGAPKTGVGTAFGPKPAASASATALSVGILGAPTSETGNAWTGAIALTPGAGIGGKEYLHG
jgi:hypothetical protein